jgi:hypothetical protein
MREVVLHRRLRISHVFRICLLLYHGRWFEMAEAVADAQRTCRGRRAAIRRGES